MQLRSVVHAREEATAADGRLVEGEPFRRTPMDVEAGGFENVLITTRTGPDTVRWRLRVTYRISGGNTRVLCHPPKRESALITCGYDENGSFEH